MKKLLRRLTLAILAVMLTFTLVACAPNSDPSKAKAALEKNNYTAAKIDADGSILEIGVITAMKLAGISNIVSVVTGDNGEGESVVIIYFSDKDAAKAELEDVQNYAGDAEVKLSGSMIYFGTEEGIKAAR